MERNDYLEHHGILGMKWGVRRYQNEDGSLTDAGKKRYGRSPQGVQKDISKQVQKKRKEIYGWEHQWSSSKTIGDNSEKAVTKYRDDHKKFFNSDEYKEYEKRLKKIEKKWDNDPERYEKEWESEREKFWKKHSNQEGLNAYAYIQNGGKQWNKEWVDKYGSKITTGYLKDLGYNQESIDYIIKKMGQYVVY